MRALAGFTTGYGNTAVGTETLDAVTEGFYNIGIGPSAGGSITTGDYNIAIGYAAFDAATTAGSTIYRICVSFQLTHMVKILSMLLLVLKLLI